MWWRHRLRPPSNPSYFTARSHPGSRQTLLILVLLATLLQSVSSSSPPSECVDVSFSALHTEFDGLRRIERIAVSGLLAAFVVDVSLDEPTVFSLLRRPNGEPLVLYSSPSQTTAWTPIDALATGIRITRVKASEEGEEEKESETAVPLLLLTLCQHPRSVISLDDSPFAVEVARAGLVSMYENELRIRFRSFRSSLLFFSASPQGDLLIAAVIHGTAHIIFDFGSPSASRISAGHALDDGEWHEIRWLHHFDSVQLFVDRVLVNQTTPAGLYRKLDLHSSVYVAGRPPEETAPLFAALPSSFRGCLAEMQLNSVDLLAFAPPETSTRCRIARPPSLTLLPGSTALVPFTFLPFSFEFRLVRRSSPLLRVLSAEGGAMLSLAVVEQIFSLTLAANATKHLQDARPALDVADGSWHSLQLRIRGSRLEIDVDGLTLLWLEGNEVRTISQRMATVSLMASGCYRSTTLDLPNVEVTGQVVRGACDMLDRCTPNPCRNGGICIQSMLKEEHCQCVKGYGGKHCETTDHYHSCEEYLWERARSGRPFTSARPRPLTIDLDGGASLPPLSVKCALHKDDFGDSRITTILEHDLVSAMRVSGMTRPGAVRRDLDYGVDTAQMERLVDGFEACTQFMRYECRGGVGLMTWGEERTASSWYATRGGRHGLQWADAPPFSRMCGCALHSNCTGNSLCNCDSGEDGVDEGENPFSQLLPVTSLFVGGTSLHSSVAVSIGPLRCAQKLVFEAVTFTDRNARLSGQKSFDGALLSVSLHLRFAHRQMSILTWESADSLHWLQLHVRDGHLVGEVVAGGHSYEVSSPVSAADSEWHHVEWTASARGQSLVVDGERTEVRKAILLLLVYTWSIGSRTGRSSLGFAGAIRNLYLNGDQILLSVLVRHNSPQGIVDGEKGKCSAHRCGNNGRCVEHFDSYVCDCSVTPFGGDDCTKEYSMFVSAGSRLSIPWQNPSQAALCHRIGVQTTATNVSLLRSHALFADCSINITITPGGQLSVSIFDGLFYRKEAIVPNLQMSNDILHDIQLCASTNDFSLSVDAHSVLHFPGNFSFFAQFNVWHFVDTNFTGCLSRLQIGSSFPLKDPKAARLSHSRYSVRFGSCTALPVATRPVRGEVTPTPEGDIIMSAAQPVGNSIIPITGIGVLGLGGCLLLSLSVLVCFMRSRPDGVYSTNEGPPVESDRKPDQPLMATHHLHHHHESSPAPPPLEKEYFC